MRLSSILPYLLSLRATTSTPQHIDCPVDRVSHEMGIGRSFVTRMNILDHLGLLAQSQNQYTVALSTLGTIAQDITHYGEQFTDECGSGTHQDDVAPCQTMGAMKAKAHHANILRDAVEDAWHQQILLTTCTLELKELGDRKPKCKVLFKAELDDAEKILKGGRKTFKKMDALARDAVVMKKGFSESAMDDVHQEENIQRVGLMQWFQSLWCNSAGRKQE
ncbi:hypothetical protein BDV96DRAFT_635472 [Lophiotrema nucula]|uniref:Uncharacterized protein n=1 Tax=Lophiotrema nucula TaxID=690887 RepID=A0A6A5YTU6_9PLEO|nr:hypothetical protein BDV96DRAFT_635472 [Lophiotrema nucula]